MLIRVIMKIIVSIINIICFPLTLIFGLFCSWANSKGLCVKSRSKPTEMVVFGNIGGDHQMLTLYNLDIIARRLTQESSIIKHPELPHPNCCMLKTVNPIAIFGGVIIGMP